MVLHFKSLHEAWFNKINQYYAIQMKEKKWKKENLHIWICLIIWGTDLFRVILASLFAELPTEEVHHSIVTKKYWSSGSSGTSKRRLCVELKIKFYCLELTVFVYTERNN